MNKRLLKKYWKHRPESLTKQELNRALRLFGSEKERWAFVLKVGDKVIDCRDRVSTITAQYGHLKDDLKLDDGSYCSAIICCSPIEETK